MSSLKDQETKRVIEKAQKDLSEIRRTVYRDDFEKLTQEIVKAVKSIDARIAQDLENLKSLTSKEREELKATFKQTTDNLKKDLEVKFNKLSEEHRQGMNYIYDKVNSLEDGQDADPEEVKNMVLAEIQFPEQKTPQEIYDAILSLNDTYEEVKTKIEELEKRPVGGRGGGHTDAGVKYSLGRIIKTETPTGSIDGANTDFTTTQPIQAILSYMLNGEVIGSGNYTVNGNTITWGTAPPAAYSGKDHEIIYV